MLQTVAKSPTLSGSTEGLRALVSAVEQLAAANSLEEIIEVVRHTARSVTGADGVTFVLRDADRCHYVEEDAVGPLWKGRRFPLTACISGWCMLNNKAAIIPDIYEDPRIPHDAYRPTFVKSLVMVPVGAGEPLAAIGSYWAECRDFGEAEITLLEALGRSTSAAVAAVRARETLRESEARLRLALDAGRLGAWELDLDTDEFTSSPLCREIFGHAAGSPFGVKELQAAIHPDDAAAARDALARARKDGAEVATSFRIRRDHGEERWIEVRGRAIVEPGEPSRRLAGVVADITERKQANARMQDLQSHLAHIARLNELGQMGSAFAHELNQPLAAGANYLAAVRRLIHSGAPDMDKVLEATSRAEAQFARAGDTIRRIRGFVGKGEPAHAPQDVAHLVSEALEIARANPRHWDVEVSLDLAPALPVAVVDRVQVQQVLLNLIRNAFEAMEHAPRKLLNIAVAPADEGRRVQFKVSDSGPGLPPEVAEHLFEPFVTTKAEGMGVGLSICRKIVEGHGGAMWTEAADGGGATFAFTVPAASAEGG